MADIDDPCQDFVQRLLLADDPLTLLSNSSDWEPLACLIELHKIVLDFMLEDLAHCRRAANVARLIAQRFPDRALVQAQACWTQGTAILYVPDYIGALSHYDDALRWYDRASAEYAPNPPPRDVRAVQPSRVFCLSELDRFTEAEEAVRASEAFIKEHPDRINVAQALLINRAQLAGRMRDYPLMIILSDEMIELATQTEDAQALADSWVNRAHACIELYRLDEADAALERGIAAAERAGEPITKARALWNRAVMLRLQGKLFAALTTLQAAAEGLEQAYQEAATVAIEQARLYRQLRQIARAQATAHQAMNVYASLKMWSYSVEAALIGIQAAVDIRKRGVARKLLDNARDYLPANVSPLLRARLAVEEAAIETLPDTINSHALMRRRRAARAAAQQAVLTLQQVGLEYEVATGQLTIAALDTVIGGDLTQAAITTYTSLAAHQDPDIQLRANAALSALCPPDQALPYLCRAADLTIEQRRKLPVEELQVRYGSETSVAHMHLAACYLALNDPEQAIASIWNAKGGPLLDMRVSSGEYDSRDAVLLEKRKAEIVYWRTQVDEITRRLEEINPHTQSDAYARFEKQKREAYNALLVNRQLLTEMRGRSGVAQIPAPADVIANLAPDTALIEFAHVGDDLIGFFLRADRPIIWRRLGSASEMLQWSEKWSLICYDVMETRTKPYVSNEMQEGLAPIWNLCIAPWDTELNDIYHLILAPCDKLHQVPWAALFGDDTYLGDRFVLSMVPCGALWMSPEMPVNLPGSPRVIGYAGVGASRLVHIDREIGAAARALKNVEIFQTATASDLRSGSPPLILHVAAHAKTDPELPIYSTLELADGSFLLADAFRLDLRGTRLVVLSACETGVRPDYGDMALALPGAFLCAGAEQVLASLWPVDDEATAALMEHFYPALGAGAAPVVALQHAQQQVRAAYPLDWAAFEIWAGACTVSISPSTQSENHD